MGERQYHETTSAYALPNDLTEQQRLEYQAQGLESLMHGRVFHSPLTKPKRILDIGCGTGRTTVQLAQNFPDAQVIGIDLSPVPPVHSKPDNVEYIQGDFWELVKSGDFRFHSGSFDYVFGRLLILGMTDWPGYFHEVTSLLAPGGWMEVQEYEMHHRDPESKVISDEWESWTALLGLMARQGLDPMIARNSPRIMRDYQLIDAREEFYKMPFVEDPRAPETMMMTKIISRMPVAVQSLWYRLGEGVYSQEQLEIYKEDLIKRAGEVQEGSHIRMYVIVGRKRED